MSEPMTTWEPLIELDAFEGAEAPTDAADADERKVHAELMAIVGGGSPSEYRSSLSPAPPPSLSLPAAEAATVDRFSGLEATAEPEAQQPGPQEPVIGGDFAEIEAALLWAVQQATTPPGAPETPARPERPPPELRASRHEPDADAGDAPEDRANRLFSAFSAVLPDAVLKPVPTLTANCDAPVRPEADGVSSNFILVDAAAPSGFTALGDEEKRSRRPLYVMAAVVVAGIAGIAASSGLGRGGASEASVQTAAMTPAEIAPAPSAAGAPAQDESASVTSEPMQDPEPRVISLSKPAPSDASATAAEGMTEAAPSILSPPPVAPTQTLADAAAPPAPAAPTLAAAAARPDSGFIKSDQLPQAAATDARAPHSVAAPTLTQRASTQHVAAKHAAAKTAALPPPRPAFLKKTASARGPHAAPSATAENARPGDNTAPAHAANAQLAQAAPADPQLVAAAPKAAAAANGPFAFVDTAVNSITGATSKLLNWGQPSPGAH